MIQLEMNISNLIFYIEKWQRATRRQKHSIRSQEGARGQKTSDFLNDRHCLFEHQIESEILNAEKNINLSEPIFR